MALAATTGAHGVTDVYGLVDCTGSQGANVLLPIYKGAEAFAPEGNVGALGATIGAMVIVDATTDDDVELSARVPLKFSMSKTIDNSSAHVAAWEFQTDTDDGFLRGSTDFVPSIGLDAPKIVMANFSADNGGAVNYDDETNVCGWYFRESQSTDTAVIATIEPFEPTGVYVESDLPATGGEFSIFDAEMPCSAWLMKQIICKNANAIAFKTVNVFSFPLVGVGSVV
jgi:hypothetical protein